ncbi:MAG: peptide MFS transporter [Gemmataceae bacterium]
MRTRHPLGLYILFLTELWERFGFYCMSAVFLYYMKNPHNGFPELQGRASRILGLYLGFVYFTPFFGGIAADRWLGYRKAVLIGGILMGAGYLLLAASTLPVFCAGLALVIVGNGLFKPNISTMVGKLYPPGDQRVDAAYTIFYMGINVGAFLAPLTAAVITVQFHNGIMEGYRETFIAAAVGMVVSVVTLLAGNRWIAAADRTGSSAAGSTEPEVPWAVQWRRYEALLIIFGVVILFWMAFKQNAGTFNLWAMNHTHRTPAPWLRDIMQVLRLDKLYLEPDGRLSKPLFSAINPFFVIAFSPLLVWFWGRLRHAGHEPPTPAKVGLGMLLTATAFSIMAVGGLSGGDTGQVSGVFLVGAYAVLTLGELCLSPMGLSLVSKLAAAKWRSMWMGGWFVATALGGYLSGEIGGFWDDMPHSRFFGLLAGSSLLAFGLLMLFYRRVAAAMPAQKK